MTPFGIIYVILTVLGGISSINEIGKLRKPVTAAEVSAKLLISGLTLWGLWVWGLH